MHVRHLSVSNFRSYESAELPLSPGVTTLVGLNGQGKTNLVEAIGYLATLSSHRVATDQPLVRFGASQAVIRGAVVRDGRETLVELELNPGRANRARLGRSPVPRPRDVLGTLRTVLFAPEDLALVKGDPSERRRFLDDLLVARQPRWAGVRSDYDKVLKQRNALLKSAAPVLRKGSPALAARRRRRGGRRRRPRVGAAHPRRVERPPRHGRLPAALRPPAAAARPRARTSPKAYDEVSAGQSDARVSYQSRLREEAAPRPSPPARCPEAEELRAEILAAARGGARPGGRARHLASSARTATTSCSRSASCRPRATPATASPGRSRWGSSSRHTSCCGTTSATTRCSSSTTCSPSSTPAGASGWRR